MAKPRLQYEIPNPEPDFAYQPGTLKPLALQVDTNAAFFHNSNYIKAGFGVQDALVQAGFSSEMR